MINNKTSKDFKLLVFDLDDTLVFHKDGYSSVFSPGVIDILSKISKNPAYKIIILTGRVLGSAEEMGLKVGIESHELIIGANNGSVVYDGGEGKIVFDAPLTNSEIKTVADIANECNVGIIYVKSDKTMDVLMLSSGPQDLEKYSPGFDHNYKKLSIEEIQKERLIGGHAWGEPKHLDKFQKILASKTKMTLTRSLPVSLQFSHGNKLTALKIICERLDIKPEEVLGFGDGNNDICWFEYYPYCVALKNAHSKLKSLAWAITEKNCVDGGVADFLKKLGF